MLPKLHLCKVVLGLFDSSHCYWVAIRDCKITHSASKAEATDTRSIPASRAAMASVERVYTVWGAGVLPPWKGRPGMNANRRPESSLLLPRNHWQFIGFAVFLQGRTSLFARCEAELVNQSVETAAGYVQQSCGLRPVSLASL